MISPALLALLTCPRCGGRPRRHDGDTDLTCDRCGYLFAVRDGVLIAPSPSSLPGRDTTYHDTPLSRTLAGRSIAQPYLGAAVRQRLLRRWLFRQPVGPVLDVGCGDGRFAYWNRRRAHVVGLDPVDLFANEARRAVDLVQADARALPFAAGAFRAAYSIDVFEHLDLAGLACVLSEVHRVLAPGGHLFVFTNSREPSTFQPVIALQQQISRQLRARSIGDFATDDLRKADHVKAFATFEDFVALAARHRFAVRRQVFWNGLAQGWIDNVLLRAAEHVVLRQPAGAPPSGNGANASNRPASPRDRQVVARRRDVAIGLSALTAMMQLDVALLGRFRSGPFFALLERR